MKKMCKYYNEEYKIKLNKSPCRKINNHCPKNTNSRCEIVKPKEKWVKIKAWGFYFLDRKGRNKLYANTIKTTMPVKHIECYILVKKKDLK
jgi:hypothetical protein